MKSSLSTYKNYLKKNLIKFDPNQESAMLAIDEFLSFEFSLKPKFYKNFLKRRKSKNGVYLYGVYMATMAYMVCRGYIYGVHAWCIY